MPNIIKKPEKSIRYSYVVTAILFLFVGIFFTLIIKNYIDGEKIVFSTLDLINLIFSVGLSTASIVLAVTAIILSKKSEQSIISRNDEAIRYQDDIFNKTIGVLSKIETSTGISERRIDDIAQELRRVQMSKPGSESKDDQVKGVLRRALHSLSDKDDFKRPLISVKDTKQEEFTKIEGVMVVKVGSGDFDELGEEMVDGIFSMEGKRFSVSTFYCHGTAKIINFVDLDTYRQYFLNLASEISKNTFEKSFLVFSKDVDKEVEFKKLFDQTLSILDSKISKKIVLIPGQTGEISEKITEELKK
jgi:hypothetical protein